MMMARITGFLRSDPARRSRPVQVVAELNDMLLELSDRTGCVMPCSLLYAVIDAPSGIGFFVNAGHPRPLLCRGRSCTTMHFGDHNLLLGVDAFEPEESCHTFVDGERIVLYTDGITEAQNASHEHFDDERLHDVVVGCAECEPQQLAESVFSEVDRFRNGAPQKDDETVLVIDRS